MLSDLWYVFIPKNCTKTLAEMSDDERKNRKDDSVNPFIEFNSFTTSLSIIYGKFAFIFNICGIFLYFLPFFVIFMYFSSILVFLMFPATAYRHKFTIQFTSRVHSITTHTIC